MPALKMPEQIRLVLEARREAAFSRCHECDAGCCNGPGFAILENVMQIYERYRRGLLVRSDLDFEPGMTLGQFVFSYFDRAIINDGLLLFFPKMVTDDSRLLSVPPWNFWQAREYLLRRNRSYGCIFLDRRRTDDDTRFNPCILHGNPKIQEEITEMPIDCMYCQCSALRQIVKPRAEESSQWFRLLETHFPGSVQRYKALCPDDLE